MPRDAAIGIPEEAVGRESCHVFESELVVSKLIYNFRLISSRSQRDRRSGASTLRHGLRSSSRSERPTRSDQTCDRSQPKTRAEARSGGISAFPPDASIPRKIPEGKSNSIKFSMIEIADRLKSGFLLSSRQAIDRVLLVRLLGLLVAWVVDNRSVFVHRRQRDVAYATR